MSDDWSNKAEWMRKAFATEAAWSVDGTLTHLKLGPVASTTPERETQPSITPQERERRERQQRRDLTQRSSGGPVMRIDGD